MTEAFINDDYKAWLTELKSRIQASQIKAALAVNGQLIQLYWDLGRQIVEMQKTANWGSGLIEKLSRDLIEDFPDMKGFSRTNLFSMRQFYQFYTGEGVIVHQAGGRLSDEVAEDTHIVRQAGGLSEKSEDWAIILRIPWRHHVLILQKIKVQSEALFYIKETIANNWSRAVLEMQIDTNLYRRQGRAITNFKSTLPENESDLANALLKDPYNFDFLNLSKEVKERELEEQLVANITQFLLEMGKGFAYLGKQFALEVGGRDFRTDLLFYHTRLKRYVVVELKVTEFEPEFLGKLNFYLTAIDQLVKAEDDGPTIGILLCKSKNNLVVDFSLRDIEKPLGVSEFTYTELPADVREAFPTFEQFAEHLNK